jgi:hypothetical protein
VVALAEGPGVSQVRDAPLLFVIPGCANGSARSAIRFGERHVLLGLIAQSEALQERRRLGILHRLTLCSGVLFGRDLYWCILLPPDLFSGILHRPDLYSRILHVTDLSVHLHRPDLSSGILHNLCWGILSRLSGSDLCPLILLCCPRLVLLEQVIG